MKYLSNNAPTIHRIHPNPSICLYNKYVYLYRYCFSSDYVLSLALQICCLLEIC